MSTNLLLKIQTKPVEKKVESGPFKTLVIKITQGKNLVSKDSNGKSDPYCKVWLGSNKFQTKVKAKTLNPVWDDVFTIPSEKCGKVIDIEVWDTNVLLKDEFMGEIKLQVDQIPNGETQQWHKLCPSKDKKKKGAVSGEIHIHFTKV